MLRSPFSFRGALGVFVLSFGALGQKCPESRAENVLARPPTKPAPAATPTAAPTFQTAVRPILEVRCAPCHNPGGKMYARLPFDEPAVVAAHASGVRRRLKGDDLAAVEAWLATLPPPTPGPEPAY
jgi:hypothetical protein